jgi:hypothetical protein
MNNKLSVLISILIIFTSVSCAHVYINSEDDNLSLIQEKSFNISAGKQLELTTAGGEIQVSTWDKNEVHIKVFGNDNAKDKIDFTFEGSSDKVEVTAKKKDAIFSSLHNIQMRFEIMVPKNFNNNLKTAGGNISLAGLSGEQNVKTSGGNINLKNLTGNLKGATSGGDLRIEDISGNVKLSTSGGNIGAKNFSGDFDCSTSGGNIKLSGKDVKIKAHTSGGNIEVEYLGENKGIELSTSGGSIRIKVPADFNASAKLQTSGGDIDSDFKGNNAVKISSSRFEADINKGGNPLVAKTSGGDIKLIKQ